MYLCMKKIVFILTAMFVTIAVSAQESQDNTPLFKDFSFEIKSLYGIKQHGLQPLRRMQRISRLVAVWPTPSMMERKTVSTYACKY